ncbi:MAG: aspartate/glutamate racemase family protein, partial [Pseudomonadota bacterium]
QLAVDDVIAAVDADVVTLMAPLHDALKGGGFSAPLLLGTPVVMEGPFYRSTLRDRFGVETTVPSAADQETVRRVIFDELVEGVVSDASRAAYLDIINRGVAAGADCAILGCTEIGMLIEKGHTDVPVLDTTLLHAEAIARAAFTDAPSADVVDADAAGAP